MRSISLSLGLSSISQPLEFENIATHSLIGVVPPFAKIGDVVNPQTCSTKSLTMSAFTGSYSLTMQLLSPNTSDHDRMCVVVEQRGAYDRQEVVESTIEKNALS